MARVRARARARVQVRPYAAHAAALITLGFLGELEAREVALFVLPLLHLLAPHALHLA